MTPGRYLQLLPFVLACVSNVHAWPHPIACDVRARTDAGWVCGLRRWGEDGSMYASFRGVPYAKQPVGELRFKELEPPEPWDYDFDAREEGPVCYQTDVLYGKIMQPQGMSEACIHANIHVPLEALPTDTRPARHLSPPYSIGVESLSENKIPKRGLPILVFTHGGGFAFGSGDADLYGPEYLVSRGVIVITFNYRLNVFGFLSMNTTKIPGNAGLRDMVTLLRWVQRNARNFGGDPDNVTFGGQSAGAIAAHLLTLSEATEGLFKRVILMSGMATSNFYSPTPEFAQFISQQLLTILGITTTDPDDIYRQLINIPADKLHKSNAILLEEFGLTTFVPTVEAPLQNVTRIVDDYPEVLIAKGRGKDIPVLIGFTDAECETFRKRMIEFDIVEKVQENPAILATPKIVFTTPPDDLSVIIKKIDKEYFNGNITMDKYINYCSDVYFEYPVLDFVEKHAELGGGPAYLYQFTYESEYSVLQVANSLIHQKAGHIEDLTYVFRVNSMLGSNSSFPPRTQDDRMKYWMTTFFINFMTNGEPVWEEFDPPLWSPVVANDIRYQDIHQPGKYQQRGISQNQEAKVKFFNSLTSQSGAK